MGTSAKEALRHLKATFAQPSSSWLVPELPEASRAEVDSYVETFSAWNPMGGGGGIQRESEADRERARWREGLIEILSGLEGAAVAASLKDGDETKMTCQLSAFLLLLERLSAQAKDDDPSAVITRMDICHVWWDLVLRRIIVGVTPSGSSTPLMPAGQKAGLAPSRAAREAAIRMVAWGMEVSPLVEEQEAVATAFSKNLLKEYERKTNVMDHKNGMNIGYASANLEECLMTWAEKSPKAFFDQIADLIESCRAADSADGEATAGGPLPFLCLLLRYLSLHSSKAYHALKTRLISTVTSTCLSSTDTASVAVGTKILVIFLVTLPVIIGEPLLLGILCVYARLSCWGATAPDDDEQTTQVLSETPATEKSDQMLHFRASSVGPAPPPNPLPLFNALYGIYPCNFLVFIRDLRAYMDGKQAPDFAGEVDAALMKDRSAPLLRKHAFHPFLLTFDPKSELVDLDRWQNIEPADVMARCNGYLIVQDGRGVHAGGIGANQELEPVLVPTAGQEQGEETPTEGETRGRRGEVKATTSSTPPQPAHSPLPSVVDEPAYSVPASFYTRYQDLGSAPRSASLVRTQGSQRSQSASSARSASPSAASGASFTPGRARQPPIRVVKTPATVPNTPSVGAVSSFAPSIPEEQPERSPSANALRGADTRMRTHVLLLQSEVNYLNYLRSLHLAHLGTLHRERVLDLGDEAERQSLYRAIRILRAQLSQTSSSLEQIRSEAAGTKLKWISHIDDLKEKLKSLRDARLQWQGEDTRMKATIRDLTERNKKQAEELEKQGAALFDLQNQVSVDEPRLARVTEYEGRIESLTKTLMLCDEDLQKYVEQQKASEKLVAEYYKVTEALSSANKEIADLKAALRAHEEAAVSASAATKSKAKENVLTEAAGVNGTTTESESMAKLRKEVARLRLVVSAQLA